MFAKTPLFRLLSALLIGGMLLGNAALPVSVRADSLITVNTADDELNADGDCSLREAIQAANTNSAVDACVAGTGADTINIPAGTYTLTIVGKNEDANATGDLDITDSVTINGAEMCSTIIQAGTSATNGIDRVLQVFPGAIVSINNTAITNGVCAGVGCLGGGVYNNNGALTITNCNISNNTAYRGGGIYNLGDLTIRFSAISDNIAKWAGGGIFHSGGILKMEYDLLSDNSSTLVAGYGGGIYHFRGEVEIDHTVVSNNAARFDGGGIYSYAGILTISNSTFSGNTTRTDGYNAGGGIFKVLDNASVINSTFVGNSSHSGGGIAISREMGSRGVSVAVTNSTFSKNYASQGGGISNGTYWYEDFPNGGDLIVTNSTFSGNSAPWYAAGILNEGNVLLNNSILANSSDVCWSKLGGTVSGTNNLIQGQTNCTTTSPITANPNLGPLSDNGGSTQTFALLPGSPAIDAGNDAICAAAPVNNTSQNGVTRPQGVHCDIGSFEFPLASPYTFRSIGANDGWVLESTETSGKGGTINVNGQAITLGDHPLDRQYRSILHFDTASLPDNAVITKVTLALKKKSVVGTDPFTTHQYIKVDIKNGSFSNNPTLQLTDFQAFASKSWIGTIKNNPVGDWYSAVLKTTAFPYINLTGATQFRLYFALDDDDDNIADLIKFYSGDDTAANRPQLIVEYYVP